MNPFGQRSTTFLSRDHFSIIPLSHGLGKPCYNKFQANPTKWIYLEPLKSMVKYRISCLRLRVEQSERRV